MLEDLHMTIPVPNDPLVPQPNKVSVSPINRLPPELLSWIFECGCEEVEVENDDSDDDGDSDGDDDSDASLSPGSLPFPILVSRICSQWRAVALSTPSLWTTIKVYWEARSSYEQVSTLLERSKTYPIDVYCYLEEHEGLDDEQLDDISFLFGMLASHVHRWRTMQLYVFDYRHICSFFRAISNPLITGAPQLRVLDLTHVKSSRNDHFSIDISQNAALFGGSVPLLTRLILSRVHLDWSLPWVASAPNLKELQLMFHAENVRPSWAQFATLLRSISTLESLTLRNSGPSGHPLGWFIEPTPESPGDLNAPIPLPYLTHFDLALHSEMYSVGLLQRLSLPALKNLCLEFDRGDYTGFIRELARPVAHAQGQPHSLLSGLESLRIGGLPCRTASIRTLYSELQNLRSLDLLLMWDLPTLFLDVLCTPCTSPGQNVWLPRLTRLRVSAVSGDVLRRLVEKRMEAGVPLEWLSLGTFDNMKEKDVAWLRKNVKLFPVL